MNAAENPNLGNIIDEKHYTVAAFYQFASLNNILSLTPLLYKFALLLDLTITAVSSTPNSLYESWIRFIKCSPSSMAIQGPNALKVLNPLFKTNLNKIDYYHFEYIDGIITSYVILLSSTCFELLSLSIKYKSVNSSLLSLDKTAILSSIKNNASASYLCFGLGINISWSS